MIKISFAKLSDAAAIRRLENKTWGGEVVSKYDVPMFIQLGYVFVAKDQNKIIGAICSYLTKRGEVHVCDWVVDKTYRGQNIGLKLFNKLLLAVKNRPLISYINIKNAPSLAAHKKLGFKFKSLPKSADPFYLVEGGKRVLARLAARRARL